MPVRGIRGAVVSPGNTAEDIISATCELFLAVQRANPSLEAGDIASLFFTVTPDLDAAFPALAVRQLGWVRVPMLCATEIPVPGSLKSCIRLLVHWNTELPEETVQHIYLGEAAVLRPDFGENNK